MRRVMARPIRKTMAADAKPYQHEAPRSTALDRWCSTAQDGTVHCLRPGDTSFELLHGLGAGEWQPRRQPLRGIELGFCVREAPLLRQELGFDIMRFSAIG